MLYGFSQISYIVASALFLSWAMSIHANEPLTMAVSPVQSFAPTNLTIRVHDQVQDHGTGISS